MRVQKLNAAFLRLFEMEALPAGDGRLADIQHPFWTNPEIKDKLRWLVVNGEPIRQSEFGLHTRSGEACTVRLSSKNIGSQGDSDRKIYIMVEEL